MFVILLSSCLSLLIVLIIVPSIAVVDVRFEESEYSINERAANNQYVALRVCLRQTDTDLIPDTDTFTVTIATQGGTAIGKSLL